MDFILDWEQNMTSMYIDGKIEGKASDFYEATDRYYRSKESAIANYEGVNAVMLYTLSRDTTSTFKEVKICNTRCNNDGADKLKFSLTRAARGGVSISLLCSTLLLYLSI
mgnify:CR=1 FL=1